MRPRSDRLSSLLKRADVGRKMAEMIEDPLIDKFFDALEARLLSDLLDASKAASNDELRARSIALSTTRDLRAFIRATAADGLRAEEKYAGMTINGETYV